MQSSKIQTNLLQIILPKITRTREQLLHSISQNKPKSSLYLLYSEFFLRAKHNYDYATILLESELIAVDGKGVLWALNRVRVSSIKDFYILNYLLNYIFGVISAIWSTLSKAKYSHSVQNILGRDLVYDIMNIANQKSWKVIIVGANLQLAQKNLMLKYPNCSVFCHSFNVDSKMMKDGLDFGRLNRKNLLEIMPDLLVARNLIADQMPDLVLVCLGGTSGKQEFFIDNLKQDSSVSFGLAVGLGAALDHFGGGKNQKPAPTWIQTIGLESLWRIFAVPRRTKRILDSVFGLIEYVVKSAG